MDYEKKYKEALGRARTFSQRWQGIEATDSELALQEVKEIFPELKKSDDEKIRKTLKSFFDSEISDYGNVEWRNGIRYGEIVSWLEKQGEQKPTNEVESKFHAGDFITDGKRIFQIEETIWERNNRNDGSTYCESLIVNLRDGNTYANNTDLKEYHLWTIQDAKDGDVLVASDGSIFIFKEVEDCGCKHYIALEKDSKTIDVNDNLERSWESVRGVNPSTREQRDLLFQKMKEAGYEWDAEEKKLKKIGENLAWSEEDERICQETIDWFEKKCFPYALESQNPARESITWLKSLKERVQSQSN